VIDGSLRCENCGKRWPSTTPSPTSRPSLGGVCRDVAEVVAAAPWVHRVLRVVGRPELPLIHLFRVAATARRRIVTENVTDYRLLHQAEETGIPTGGVLFTSSCRFPRSRKNPGPLIEALDAWLRRPDLARRPPEDWLMPAARRVRGDRRHPSG
jgi:hypothetical protein